MDKKKDKWISDKIKKLRHEGKTQEQSVAIAYSMYSKMLSGGTYEEKPKYQMGTANTQGQSNPNLWNFFMPNPEDYGQMWNAMDGAYAPAPQSVNQSEKYVPFGSSIQEQAQQQTALSRTQIDNPTFQTRQPVQSVGNPFVDPFQNMKQQSDQFVQQEGERIGQKPNNNSPIEQPYSDNTYLQFNPYGGLGLEQSIAYAGQGFGSGNVLQGLAGTALTGLKGARTFMSNFATAKEEERRQREYRKKMNPDPIYTYAQQGGMVPYTEKELLRLNNATGLMLTEEGAQRINPKSAYTDLPDLDLGRYGDLGYYDVQKMGQEYIIRPSERNIKSAQDYKNDLFYLQKLNPDAKIAGMHDSRFYRMEEGGKISVAESLTGEYITEQENSNVEIEENEFVENSETGAIQKAVGDKHEDGGIKTNLPDGSKVISDYTKIGKENAKMFRDEFGVTVKANDTYATVLDMYNKSIGLDKLIEEETEVYEKIEQQTTDGDIKENVKNMNLQALQSKLQEIETNKKELEVQKKEAFDKIFEAQERAPKKKEESKMTYGGTMNSDLEALSKKYGIDKNRIMELMQEGGVYNNRQRLEDFYNEAKRLGYQGDFNIDAENIGEEVGKLQQFFVENYPEQVVGYFDRQPITAKGVETIKKEHPELFERAGIPKNKKPADYTNEERHRLQETFRKSEFDNKQFWLDQFHDSTWNRDNADTWRQLSIPIDVSPFKKDINPLEVKTPEVKGIQQPEQQPTVEQPKNPEVVQEADGSFNWAGIPLVPNDFILPPSARQPVYKHQVQFGRLDPLKATAEPNLVEIERQRQALEAATQFMPPAQRAAVMANALGQSQQAANQAISGVTESNAQRQTQADMYNLNTAAKEDLTNIGFAKDYENKTMAAITNQERDVRQYFNDLNDQQRYNFEYIERRNLLNQAFPQYNAIGSNIEFAGAPDFTYVTPFLSGKKIEDMTPEERMAEMKRRTEAYLGR